MSNLFFLLLGNLTMRIREIITEKFTTSPTKDTSTEVRKISKSDLDYVERVADKLWSNFGIDVEFTTHFLDRVNDPRNGKQITVDELVRLFNAEYYDYAERVAAMNDNDEAVMKDLFTKLNLPFVIDDKDDADPEKDLVAKTIMRKKNFYNLGRPELVVPKN